MVDFAGRGCCLIVSKGTPKIASTKLFLAYLCCKFLVHFVKGIQEEEVYHLIDIMFLKKERFKITLAIVLLLSHVRAMVISFTTDRCIVKII